MIARRLVVHGRVQGVGFRYAMVEAAERLGVSGWVRNAHDGSVEALVQGDEPAVEQIVEWGRKGPPGARVTSIDIEAADVRDEFTGFTIRH